MLRWKKVLLIVIIVTASVSLGAAITYVATKKGTNVPQDIRSNLSFSPLVPASSEVKTSDYKLAKAEDETQTLGYVVTINDSKIVVSQYPQPAQFNDVPEYKERFLSSVLNQTDTIQTANGVIYIGKSDTDNRQIAVMLERGLLIFFNPVGPLSNDTWRTVGDSLVAEKSTN